MNKTLLVADYTPRRIQSQKNRVHTQRKGVKSTPFLKMRTKLFSNLFLQIENVRKKRHVACALDCLGDFLLILQRNAGILARNDLIELSNVLLEEFGVFIVDRLDTCLVDGTYGLSHGMGR